MPSTDTDPYTKLSPVTTAPSTWDTIALTPSPPVPVLSNVSLSLTLYSLPPPSTRYESIFAEENLL